jgi:hypothetical protein
VCGEPLFFKVTMDNKSTREIKEMTVNLVQNIQFHATRKTKTTFRTVASVSYPKNVPEKTVTNWSVGIGKIKLLLENNVTVF